MSGTLKPVAEQDAYSSTRSHVLEECQLIHPITYDIYNLSDMYTINKLTKLSVPMLSIIRQSFDTHVDSLPPRLKNPYV